MAVVNTRLEGLTVPSLVSPLDTPMLTSVAWTLADGTTHYALEGAIFVLLLVVLLVMSLADGGIRPTPKRR